MYAFIGDLHIGVKLPQIDFLKSLDKFLGIIKNHKEECHCIFVVGDLFEHRLSIQEAKFAAIILVNLVCNNCGRNGRQHVPVHFIHGTSSHDNEQYEIFMPMLEKLPNTSVFYTKSVCYKNLSNGVKVLYAPQEYVSSGVDYEQVFSESYDIIVGHGPISSMTKTPCKSMDYEITHSAEKLGEISKICVFGHFHGYTDFGNNVYYTGPWLRWKYGEDTPRVFFLCNDNFEAETYPNDVALEFETMDIYSPEQLRLEVSQEIKNPHRFIIHCKPEDLNDYHAIMNIYKRNQYIKYQIVSEHRDDTDVKKLLEQNTQQTVEVIPALIEYVKDRYKEDVSEEVHEYESRINRDKPDVDT